MDLSQILIGYSLSALASRSRERERERVNISLDSGKNLDGITLCFGTATILYLNYYELEMLCMLFHQTFG